MKTVFKVMLGILLAGVVLIVGCAALIGGAANEVQKESDKTSITAEQYQSVGKGDTRSDVEDRLGPPSDAQDFDQERPEGLEEFVKEGEEDMACIYYSKQGEIISAYQFCFDGNGKFESKASY